MKEELVPVESQRLKHVPERKTAADTEPVENEYLANNEHPCMEHEPIVIPKENGLCDFIVA